MSKNIYYACLVIAESLLPASWFARLIGIPVQFLLAYQVIDEVAIKLDLYTFDTQLWKAFKEDSHDWLSGDLTHNLFFMCIKDMVSEERWIAYNAFVQYGDIDEKTLDEIPGMKEWLDEEF